jgi:hypothetical protein
MLIYCEHLEGHHYATSAMPNQGFPYLGMPLSICRQFKRNDFHPLLDNLHHKFSGWNVGLVSKGDRLVMVKSMLSAMLIHTMLATIIPSYMHNTIIKCQRSFCVGQGWQQRWQLCHCLARGVQGCRAWRPQRKEPAEVELGIVCPLGLVQRVDTSKPWENVNIKSSKHTLALVHAATKISLGNGSKVFFWTDPWIGGQSVADHVSTVQAIVRPNIACRRLLDDALARNTWITDIVGTLNVQGIVEFLHLVEIVNVPTLLPDTEDSTSWKFTNTLPNRKHMMPCSRNNQLTTLEIYLGRLGAGKVQGVVWLPVTRHFWTAGRRVPAWPPRRRHLCFVRSGMRVHFTLDDFKC